MPRDPDDAYAPGEDGGKDCPVCDQEYNGICPLRSSDCPFAYDALPDDIDLDDDEDDDLPPDLGLDDDFEDIEEDDEEFSLIDDEDDA